MDPDIRKQWKDTLRPVIVGAVRNIQLGLSAAGVSVTEWDVAKTIQERVREQSIEFIAQTARDNNIELSAGQIKELRQVLVELLQEVIHRGEN